MTKMSPTRKRSKMMRENNKPLPPPSKTTLMLQAMLEKPNEGAKKKPKLAKFVSVGTTINNKPDSSRWSGFSRTPSEVNQPLDVFSRKATSLITPTSSSMPLLLSQKSKSVQRSHKKGLNHLVPRDANKTQTKHDSKQVKPFSFNESKTQETLRPINHDVSCNLEMRQNPELTVGDLDRNLQVDKEITPNEALTVETQSVQLNLSLHLRNPTSRRKRVRMPAVDEALDRDTLDEEKSLGQTTSMSELNRNNNESIDLGSHTIHSVKRVDCPINNAIVIGSEARHNPQPLNFNETSLSTERIAGSFVPRTYTNATYPESFASSRPLAAENVIPNVIQPAKTKENFVRLNLKNHAGACRGARSKARFRKWRTATRNTVSDGDCKQNETKNPSDNDEAPAPKERRAPSAGVDPLDDYLDGVFQTKTVVGDAPKCARHQLPCSLRTVKKAGGNKGRKFYSCSMPRGEQCDHFQWADDTLQAAKAALDRSSTYSGFVARQVSGHLDRLRCLTVDELRQICKQRNLQSSGKRQQLLTRLSIWVRDELVQSNPEEEIDAAISKATICLEEDGRGSWSDESDGESTSSLELEISDANNSTLSLARQKKLEISTSAGVHSTSGNNTADHGATLHVTNIHRCLKEYFGYDHFRDGQEWAILRCLNKQRSLLVAPTGFGKSLCYALPAALMDGVCIVVSPLISLIEDQLRQLPPKIPAVSLSGSLSTAATVSTIDDILRGRVKIVFVSPERLASASFQRLFISSWNQECGKHQRLFPTVSLLCVDEAHCASQWGINFRPSYLRIKSLLRNIEPQSVLAITATAVPLVIDDICGSLEIRNEDRTEPEGPISYQNDGGVLVLQSDRDNVDVACLMMSNQDERLSMLVRILTPAKQSSHKAPSPSTAVLRIDGCLAKGSVIIYVWRQVEAEVIAENISAMGVSGGVVIYHGGMDSAARATAQSKFLRGKARICVATVAFGLGVNKEDVSGVVHMQLPASPEHYLQEIGRAGRDGNAAHAFALVLKDEVVIRHSLAHSDLISKSQIAVLLEKLRVITGTAFKNNDKLSAFVNVAVPLQSFSLSCDCKAETIETVLSLIEQRLPSPPLFTFESVLGNMATISLKQRTLEKLATKEPIAQAILKCGVCVDPPAGERKGDSIDGDFAGFSRQHQFFAYSFGSYRFSVVECANQLGQATEPRHVFAALRRLQSANEIELSIDSSPSGKAVHIKVEEAGRVLFVDSSEGALNDLSETIFALWDSVVRPSATKVLDIADIVKQVAGAAGLDALGAAGSVPKRETTKNSETPQRVFHRAIRNYFEGKFVREACDSNSELPLMFDNKFLQELSYDVASLISELAMSEKRTTVSVDPHFVKLNDPAFVDYSALAVTKFFHGLNTTRAPTSQYGKHRLFGKWRQVRFCSLLESVTKLLHER